MSEAKAMKLREYGTDIISHELCYSSNADQNSNSRYIRNTDTFKSRVLDSTLPDPVFNIPRAALKTAINVHEKSRERLLVERPLAAKVQRTSYQDSNIFGYKDEQNITVQ